MGMQSSRMLQLEQAIFMRCLSTFDLEGRGVNLATRGMRGGTKNVLLVDMVHSCSGFGFSVRTGQSLRYINAIYRVSRMIWVNLKDPYEAR
jgi:hypothetical protein